MSVRCTLARPGIIPACRGSLGSLSRPRGDAPDAAPSLSFLRLAVDDATWTTMPQLSFTEVSRRRLRKLGLSEQAVYDVIGDPEHVFRRPDGITEYTGWWDGRRIVVFTDRPSEPLLVLSVVVTRGSKP